MGYGMIAGAETIQFVREPIHGVPAEKMGLQGANIDGFFGAPIWKSLDLSQLLGHHGQGVLSRFIEAFPEQNGWLMMSMFKAQPLWLERFPDAMKSCNAWFDIKNGKLAPIEGPVNATGESLSSLASRHVIWPDRNGVHHTLCANEAQWREDYFRQASLFADVGEGLISMEEARSQIEKDKRLSLIETQIPDANYVRFLAALRAAGGLSKMQPMNKANFEEHRKRLESAMQALWASRPPSARP